MKRFVLVSACSLAGCSGDHGWSRDWGIIKWGDPEDHVVTVHGFADNRSACEILEDALNADACVVTGGKDCLNPYSCIPLD